MSARRLVGLLAVALVAAAVGATPSPAAQPRVTVQSHVRALDDGTLKVTFDATARSPVVGYRWSFGDPRSRGADTSSERQPMHVYARGRSYRVHVQVVFGNGQRASSTYMLRL